MNNPAPQYWEECKLGDVAEYINRGTTPEYVDSNGITILNQKCIRNGKIDFNPSRFTSKRKTINQEKLLQKGDILINSTGVGTVGRVAYYSDEQNITVDSYISIVRLKKENVVSKFIYYSLFGIESYIETLAEGSTGQSELGRERIKEITFPLPPLPEQRAIACILSSLDDKIALLHRQNKTLEAMAETLWRKMFVEDVDPNWKKCKLGDVCTETIGGDWGEDNPSDSFIPAICLRGIDLQNIKENGFSSVAPIRFVTPSSLEKRTLNENEILIAGSGIGPIGKSIPIHSALLTSYAHPVIYSNFCKRLRARTRQMAYFIEFMIYMLYKDGELDQFHMGTSLPNFNLKGFLNYEITIPSDENIYLFSSFLTSWYGKKYKNQIRTLSSLRDTLLPKLMSGEVRVKV